MDGECKSTENIINNQLKIHNELSKKGQYQI